VQVAGFMRRGSLSPANFLDIHDTRELLDGAEFHDSKVGNQHGYDLTLSSSWALHNFSDGAAALSSVISLLDPHSVEDEILTIDPKRVRIPNYPIDAASFSRDSTELVQAPMVQKNDDLSEIPCIL
jgi:hypothetical protein